MQSYREFLIKTINSPIFLGKTQSFEGNERGKYPDRIELKLKLRFPLMTRKIQNERSRGDRHGVRRGDRHGVTEDLYDTGKCI